VPIAVALCAPNIGDQFIGTEELFATIVAFVGDLKINLKIFYFL
jgi:hypothetical protein